MKLKLDWYTKLILTLIAVGLFANVIKDMDFVSSAMAAPASPEMVAIPSPQPEEVKASVMDVNIMQIDGRRVSSSFGTMRVRVED